MTSVTVPKPNRVAPTIETESLIARIDGGESGETVDTLSATFLDDGAALSLAPGPNTSAPSQDSLAGD